MLMLTNLLAYLLRYYFLSLKRVKILPQQSPKFRHPLCYVARKLIRSISIVPGAGKGLNGCKRLVEIITISKFQIKPMRQLKTVLTLYWQQQLANKNCCHNDKLPSNFNKDIVDWQPLSAVGSERVGTVVHQ